MDILKVYKDSLNIIDILPYEQEEELIILAKAGNPDAIKTILESYVTYILYYAKKYCKKGVDLVDLVQAGNIGLLRAIKDYENIGSRFRPYCVQCICGDIKREIQKNGNLVRRPYTFWTKNSVNWWSKLTAEQKNILMGRFVNQYTGKNCMVYEKDSLYLDYETVLNVLNTIPEVQRNILIAIANGKKRKNIAKEMGLHWTH